MNWVPCFTSKKITKMRFSCSQKRCGCVRTYPRWAKSHLYSFGFLIRSQTFDFFWNFHLAPYALVGANFLQFRICLSKATVRRSIWRQMTIFVVCLVSFFHFLSLSIRKYDEAIHYFQSALRLSPRNASIHSALGFTFHMRGDLEQAIESYHAALAYNSEETLAGEMITVAFEESLSSGRDLYSINQSHPPPNSRASLSMLSTPLSSTPATGALAGIGSGFGAVPEAQGGGRRREEDAQELRVRRTLTLDASFSSIDQSHHSMACSSLDFSDDNDSKLNVEEIIYNFYSSSCSSMPSSVLLSRCCNNRLLRYIDRSIVPTDLQY